MKSLMIAAPLLLAGLGSCDKAKEAAEAVRVKLGGVTDPGAPADPGGNVEPGLASQVDSAAEGVRFRRDLTFPANVEVRVVDRQAFKNVRMVSKSEIGSQAVSYTGTWETAGSIKRLGSGVLIAIEKSGEVLELEKDGEEGASPERAKANVASVGSAAGVEIQFELGPKGWQIPASRGPVQFGAMILGRKMLPTLPDLLARQGALARPQWFSPTRRWIGGDKFVLEGESMALLFPGRSSGRVTLTYEAAEALEGHPCGRFSVEGDVSLEDDVDLEGEISDSEVTINSGKIWCSLIYPLVLREEYDTVQTLVRGVGKGPKLRVQGAVERVIGRRWVAGTFNGISP